MEIVRYPDTSSAAAIERLLQRPAQSLDSLRAPAMEVINAVRCEGDEAVRRYTLQFDGVTPDDL
jgi:histidinol dehydrogenase